jgi:hypothetical protein
MHGTLSAGDLIANALSAFNLPATGIYADVCTE